MALWGHFSSGELQVVVRVPDPPIGLWNGNEKVSPMLLLLALLLVLVFFGAGFALHILWIVAVVLLLLWVVGFAIGRGEGAGSHKFYRW
jgi:energy-coupling factor transporter transmembrane protein EcfT